MKTALKNPSANCLRKFKGLQLTFQVVTPDFPKIPVLSRDPEQRKSPTGIYPFPAPQVVQVKSQSGDPDMATHRYGQNPQHRVILGGY
jgi:hypothetical protein